MGLYIHRNRRLRQSKRKPIMGKQENGVEVSPEDTTETKPHVWTYDKDVMCTAMGTLYDSDTGVALSSVRLIESINEVGAKIWRECFNGAQPNYDQLRDWSLDWYQSAVETCTESKAVKNLSATISLKQAGLESLSESERKVLTSKRRDVMADIHLRLEEAKKQAKNFRRRLMKMWGVAYEFKQPLKDGGVSTPDADSKKLTEDRADVRSTTVDNKESAFKKLNGVVRNAINRATTVEQLEFIDSRWSEVDKAIKPFTQEAKWVVPTKD
jgi:hypothetical protein